MDLGVISVRYARALLKSATALKIEDSVCQDMMCLGRSYIEVPQLRTAIATPMLQPVPSPPSLPAASSNLC